MVIDMGMDTDLDIDLDYVLIRVISHGQVYCMSLSRPMSMGCPCSCPCSARVCVHVLINWVLALFPRLRAHEREAKNPGARIKKCQKAKTHSAKEKCIFPLFPNSLGRITLETRSQGPNLLRRGKARILKVVSSKTKVGLK
jgi:hypothetical protein